MTDAFRAAGTQFKIGDGADPEVFTTVAELRQISWRNQADQLDASNHDTPDAYREYVGGMKSCEISLEGNYLPTDPTQDGTTGLLAFFDDGQNHNMRCETPTDPVFRASFSGVVTQYSPSLNHDQVATFTATVMSSGKPTYAVVS